MYYEPFLGGGALFFALRGGLARPFVTWLGGKTSTLDTIQSLLPPGREEWSREATLSDVNEDLVCAYVAVRDELSAMVDALVAHQEAWESGKEDYYMEVRAQRPESMLTVARGARLVFLSKSGFNGLYRVNSRGRVNSPPGRFEVQPRLFDADSLRACSRALQGVRLECCSYEAALADAKPGDFAFLDPPYMPVSETSNFTGYSAHGFSALEQQKLARAYRALTESGVRAMLCNSSAPKVRELYADFRVREVLAPRSLNVHGEKRGKVADVLVFNYS